MAGFSVGDIMEDYIFKGIADIGFPIVMCFYLITKTNSAIKENTDALRELTKKIEDLLK